MSAHAEQPMTITAGASVVAQGLDLVPISIWFGIFTAVTGICRQEFARDYMAHFVQMSLVETDARSVWRPLAAAQLRGWLGAAWLTWMTPHGRLLVCCTLVQAKVRVCAGARVRGCAASIGRACRVAPPWRVPLRSSLSTASTSEPLATGILPPRIPRRSHPQSSRLFQVRRD